MSRSGNQSKSVLKLIADLELTGIEGVQRKLRRAAGEFSEAISFDDKQFLEGWTKARSEIGKTWAKTVREAAEASFSPGQLRKVVHQYEDSMKKVDASHLRVEKLAAQIRDRQAKGLESRALQQEAAIERRRLAALHKGFDEEMRHVRSVAERRKEAVEDAERLSKRTWSEAAEQIGDSLSEQFDRLKSGDVASVLKAAGRRLNTASVQASQKAGEGKSGKLFEGLSQVLGKLGPAVVALGAVVAGVAALVKIMIDADAKAKELNRTLLDSGVTAGDLATTYERTGEALDRARRSFTAGDGAFAFNRIWGTTAEEHLKVLGAYAEAGLTMRKLARGVKDAGEEMERYRDATAHALTFSKLLGISTNEVAAATAGYMEDLGMSLKGVQERFSEVELAARESGFGTKRFFSMILQATSGLTGYNVRLTQAASLLKTIGKVLGPKAGGELLSSLQRGFGQENIQDRYRRLLVTGGSTTSRVFKAEAESAVSELAKRVAEAAAPQQEAIKRTLGAYGVDLSGGKGVAQLGRLSADKQADLLFRAQTEGVSDELVRAIRTAVETSRGAAGGLATRANTLGNIGAGGTLALKLLEAQRIVGSPLHLLSGPKAMAAQNISGVSGEEYTQLVRLSENLAKLDEKLAAVQRGVRAGKPYDEKYAEQLARSQGVYVDRQGNRRRTLVEAGASFSSGQGELIGNTFEDVITSAGKEFAKVAADQVPRDIQLAQEMVHNTADITKILEQGVEYWLEQIYSVVQGIYNFLGSEKEKKSRTSAIESITGDIDKARDELRAKEKELSDLVAQMKGAQGADRAALAAQVETKRTALSALQGRVAALSKVRSKLYSTPAKFSLLSGRTPEEFKKEAIEQSRQDVLDAARGAGITGPYDNVLGQLGLSRSGERLPPPPPATSVAPALPSPESFFPNTSRAHPPSKTIIQNNHYYNNAQAISSAIQRHQLALDGQAP